MLVMARRYRSFGNSSTRGPAAADHRAMSINPLSTPQTPPAHQHHGHGHGKAVMDAAAKTLGMSDDDLKQALSSGQTLDDLAQAQGVSHDQLVAGLSDAVKQFSDPNALAERLATRRWDERREQQDASPTSRPPLGQMVDVEA
jgi:hypothetical protein